MRSSKGGRGRSNVPDRGGIRKRGPTRADRDGDLDMDGAGGGARGGKRGGRSDSDRSAPYARHSNTRDRTLNAIQNAISTNSPSQANIRHGKPNAGTGLEQVRVSGWRQSKAATNRDGGVESLIAFLEKKLNPPNFTSGPRAKITKVCATTTHTHKKTLAIKNSPRSPPTSFTSAASSSLPVHSRCYFLFASP